MRVAVIGLDSFFFSQMFAKHLRAIPGVELVGCTALGVEDGEVRRNNGLTPQEFAAQFGVPLYAELEPLLQQEKVEAVCLTTRPSRMPGLLKTLAERGIHVFAAKPVGVSAEGLAELEAIRSGAVISAGPTARFDPVLRQARDRAASGEIGEVTALRIMHQHGMLKFWPQESWYYSLQEGGIECFLAWYCFDLLHWFAGGRIVSVQGMSANTADRGSPHADVLKAVCELEGGRLGSFDVLFNVSWPFPMFEAEIIGSTGALRVQQDGYEGHLFSGGGRTSFGRTAADSLAAELADWVRACRGEKLPEIGLSDIVELVRCGIELQRKVRRIS